MKWKSIPGFEGLYEASDSGQIRSLYRGVRNEKILKQVVNKDGYCRVELYKDGKRKYLLVHRAVWESFNGSVPEGYEINHKDENRQNNNIENLELLTHLENLNYGSHNIKLRYANHRRKGVIAYDKAGKKLFEFDSIMHAIEVLNFKNNSYAHISKCCKGKKKSAYGYVWRYPDTE